MPLIKSIHCLWEKTHQQGCRISSQRVINFEYNSQQNCTNLADVLLLHGHCTLKSHSLRVKPIGSCSLNCECPVKSRQWKKRTICPLSTRQQWTHGHISPRHGDDCGGGGDGGATYLEIISLFQAFHSFHFERTQTTPATEKALRHTNTLDSNRLAGMTSRKQQHNNHSCVCVFAVLRLHNLFVCLQLKQHSNRNSSSEKSVLKWKRKKEVRNQQRQQHNKTKQNMHPKWQVTSVGSVQAYSQCDVMNMAQENTCCFVPFDTPLSFLTKSFLQVRPKDKHTLAGGDRIDSALPVPGHFFSSGLLSTANCTWTQSINQLREKRKRGQGAMSTCKEKAKMSHELISLCLNRVRYKRQLLRLFPKTELISSCWTVPKVGWQGHSVANYQLNTLVHTVLCVFHFSSKPEKKKEKQVLRLIWIDSGGSHC